MKILYLFRDLPSVMFQWQHYHFIDEMSKYNCFFDIISPDRFDTIDEYYDAVLKRIDENQYQLIMTCLGDSFLSTVFMTELKKTGIKTLLFCPDNLVVPFNHKKIAPYFDLVWLTSAETEYLFKKWKCKTVFLPYAANPDFLKPTIEDVVLPERQRRICFVGTPHGSRIKTINLLLKNNVPVTVYCSKQYAEQRNVLQASTSGIIHKIYDKIRFPIGVKLLLALIIDKLKREKLDVDNSNLEILDPVPITQLSAIYNSYYLILSFSEAESSAYLRNPVDIVNLRNFEIPMAGGVQFVRETKELKEYFKNEDSIIFYSDDGDMVNTAKHVLQDYDNERIINISKKARFVAENEHTWMHRFKTIFSLLDIQIENEVIY